MKGDITTDPTGIKKSIMNSFMPTNSTTLMKWANGLKNTIYQN